MEVKKRWRNVDIFDIKKDVIQTLAESGYENLKISIDEKTPSYYHPRSEEHTSELQSPDHPIYKMGPSILFVPRLPKKGEDNNE